jgi:hypothetical protein
LLAAIEVGNINVCRELLGQETGDQIRYQKEPDKDTPLHLAGRRKDNDMLKMFIEAGATVDAKNVRYCLILHATAAPVYSNPALLSFCHCCP